MSENKKRTPTRTILIRVICGALALLMLGSIAYSAIVYFLFS